MKIYLHELTQRDKTARVQQLLRDGEQTLILFKSKQAMLNFKAELPLMERMYVAFEGDRELSAIVRDFQQGTVKTLCSYHLWEGLDLPEEALTRVIIYDLPFPPQDPLFDAKRTFAENPFEEVELPFMQLRLQQGMGRLIRTSNDHGDIHILLNEDEQKQRAAFENILAVVPEIK